MILSDDSPLRQLPSQLNLKQTFFLDGIRYSIEMADLAHQRLLLNLMNLTLNNSEKKPDHLSFISAILDAWAIVDSVHRLRILLDQTPGIKKKSPWFRIFMQKTKEIVPLRNSIQHLNTQIETLLNLNLPVWGTLSWFTMVDLQKQTGFICTLIAGTTFKSENHIMVNPIGKSVSNHVNFITLSASGFSICLSQVIEEIEKLTREIEGPLNQQTKNLPKAGGDLLICLELSHG